MDPQRATPFDCEQPPIATMADYLSTLQAVYRVANYADSDNPDRPRWLDHDASGHQCRPIDEMLRELHKRDLITREEFQWFYDTL